jgi:hypothetical protein
VVQYSVLDRYTVIQIHITTWNIAFPYNIETFYHKINGNFLGHIEMMTNFDPMLKEHVRLLLLTKIVITLSAQRVKNDLIQNLSIEVDGSLAEEVQKMECFI